MDIKEALFKYTLRLGDNSLILGHRLSEWCGHGPILEEDIALTNIALDFVGLGTGLLGYAAQIENKGRTEDTLAYFRNEREFKNVEFSLPADQVGIHAYTITIQAIDNEDNVRNNTEQVYIEVIDNRQKVLILANAPHPDITAIAEAMRLQENYEVTVQTVDQFTDNVNKFDMLIAYQIPSLGGRGNNVVQEAFKSKIPCWFILGAHHNFNTYNALNGGFSLNGYQSKLSDKKKKELSEEEKEYKSKRKQIQDKLIKFATRIPAFMYLTDFREHTLSDVITKLEPDLFKAVTGLTVKDFNLLVSLGVFNATHMNQAVFAFRRYEDSSLSYTGIDSHPKLRHYGLYDTVVAIDEELV